MLKNFTFLVFVLVMVVNSHAQKASVKAADKAAIRANVEQMVKGWNAKNGADFAKPFAEDADYVVINGMQIKGREVIAKSHQNIFDTFYKNTNIELFVQQIRFLRPDVAVVHVTGAAKTPQADSSQRVSNARITMVITRPGNKWEIAAFQNTEIQPQPQKK